MDPKQLDSIRTYLCWILCVLLLMFGYAFTPFQKTDAGEVIAVIGLLAGITLALSLLVRCIAHYFLKLRDLANEIENTDQTASPKTNSNHLP